MKMMDSNFPWKKVTVMTPKLTSSCFVPQKMALLASLFTNRRRPLALSVLMTCCLVDEPRVQPKMVVGMRVLV